MSANRRLALMWLGMALCAAPPALAQVIVTPFASATVRTVPGFIDLDDAAGDVHAGAGVTLSMLTRGWIGVEAEATLTPSAFSGGDLVTSSRLVMVSGGVLVATPERWGWMVRPYLSLGIGVAQITSVDVARIFVVDSSPAVTTASIGAWAWLGPRVGIRAGVRVVRSWRAVEFEALETWQPSVGLSFRF